LPLRRACCKPKETPNTSKEKRKCNDNVERKLPKRLTHFTQLRVHYRSLLQNIVSFIGLFCKRQLPKRLICRYVRLEIVCIYENGVADVCLCIEHAVSRAKRNTYSVKKKKEKKTTIISENI